jgi:hypothetical protein
MAAVFKARQRVQEVAAPHRKGTVRNADGTGLNATIWVDLDGWHPVPYKPAQIEHI